jgi:hypothetical protein
MFGPLFIQGRYYTQSFPLITINILIYMVVRSVVRTQETSSDRQCAIGVHFYDIAY